MCTRVSLLLYLHCLDGSGCGFHAGCGYSVRLTSSTQYNLGPAYAGALPPGLLPASLSPNEALKALRTSTKAGAGAPLLSRSDLVKAAANSAPQSSSEQTGRRDEEEDVITVAAALSPHEQAVCDTPSRYQEL